MDAFFRERDSYYRIAFALGLQDLSSISRSDILRAAIVQLEYLWYLVVSHLFYAEHQPELSIRR